MEDKIKTVVVECSRGSDEARLSFPQVVAMLIQAGVERYRADLIRAEKIYYMPNGDSLVVPNAAIVGEQGTDFSATEVDAAVRAIQSGRITYHEFCERIAAAGCVDYLVSLAGRRAVYYGRTGEEHVEHFPAAS